MESDPLSAPTINRLNTGLLSLAESLVPDKVRKKLAEIILEQTGAGHCLLLLKDEKDVFFMVGGEYNHDVLLFHQDRKEEHCPAKLHAALYDTVEQTGKELLLSGKNFLQEDQLVEIAGGKATPFIFCTPFIHDDAVFGILCFESYSEAHPRLQQTLDAIRYLCRKASIFLHNALLHDSLKQKTAVLHPPQKCPDIELLQDIHREKLAALGRLSAAIAHEFGNPLLGIKFLLSDIEKNSALNDHRKKMISIGLDECRRLQAMIRQLRHVQQPAGGFFHPLDVEEIINRCLQANSLLLREKNITVTTEFQEDIPLIRGIEGQLYQVVTNLLLNAVDAMINSPGATLSISTFTKGNYVCFSIADTGRGMDKATSNRIFEPFFSTKPDVEGAGLGLSAGYWIISGHNGFIDVESSPGVGTVVTVSLPQTDPGCLL